MAQNERQSCRGLLSLCHWLTGCLFLFVFPLQAAHISEIDLAGSAGQAIELSQVDPETDHTLLFISASPTSSFLFGMVLDVLHVPAGTGRAGVAMVTDTVWQDDPALTTPLSSLALESGDTELPLIDNLLLVVMQGRSEATRFMNPLSDAGADAAYDESMVTDWLVLSQGDPSPAYESKPDLANVNAELGIDLLARVIDKNAGRVITRTNEPGQTIEMDTFYSGDPDPVSRQFDIGNEWVYTYTPGMSNLPLAAHMPEPGSLVLLAVSLALVSRRPLRMAG